jgi:hypothetical protein
MSLAIQSQKIPLEKLVQVQVLCDREETDEGIAEASGLPVGTVTALIEQNGWRAEPLLSGAEAHEYEAGRKMLLKRWERAMGASARWLSMRGMQMVADAESPRDFKDAAQGTKLMVEMAREAEGMGRKEEANGVGASVNLFYIEAPLGRVEKKVVEEI